MQKLRISSIPPIRLHAVVVTQGTARIINLGRCFGCTDIFVGTSVSEYLLRTRLSFSTHPLRMPLQV
jgi:hypothetical protein